MCKTHLDLEMMVSLFSQLPSYRKPWATVTDSEAPIPTPTLIPALIPTPPTPTKSQSASNGSYEVSLTVS